VRTTITLDDDVATALKRIGKGRGLKFKALVNLALREGIKSLTSRPSKRSSFSTSSVDLGSSRIANVDNVAEVLAITDGESFK
jgi:UDP:flavonoid glycosyltransferase YjiC (YdhE family)